MEERSLKAKYFVWRWNKLCKHGAMLHLRLDRDGQPEDAYFINSETAKEAINKIQQGEFPQLVLAPRKGEGVETGAAEYFQPL